MESIMTSIPQWIEAIAIFFFGLMISATAVGRVIKAPKVGESVSGVKKVIYKALAFLPTLGINPNTKKLQEAFEDLERKVSEQELQKSDSK